MASRPLADQAESFADEVMDCLQRTVRGTESASLVMRRPRGVDAGNPQSITLRTDETSPVHLTVDGVPLLRLQLDYQLQLAAGGQYIRTEKSSFSVWGMVDRAHPFFRYDFMAHPESSAVPTSHLQVYGHRDDLLHAMYVSNRSRSKPAAKKDRDPAAPRGLQMLHFPLGGTRFRPCLEDLLEFVIREFGVDTVPGWKTAIEEGRISWRHIQLASAVRDDPDTARIALAELGAGAPTDAVRLSRY